MHDPSEAVLLAGLAQGREDAFAAVYDRYGQALYRVAWTLTRSRHDAEDAVQNVLVSLLRSQVVLKRVMNLRAYLFSSLRHAVIQLAPRGKFEALPLDELPARDPDADERIDAELLILLERGLALLPLEQREVLSLKIDGGLTFAEVAAVLGIRQNTAASRYRYALEKLRAILDAGCHESRIVAAKPT
jgi:RNA polymerase sigma-70 factor (ECF subfamily)